MRKIVNGFLQDIIYNLIFPLKEQEWIGEDQNFWCLDWWAIEIGKWFLEGEVNYLAYDSPRRLNNNRNFSKETISQAAIRKKQILEKLKEDKEYNSVVVIETCRGLDTLLISQVKNWQNIYVYHWSDFPEVAKQTKRFLLKKLDGLIFLEKASGVIEKEKYICICPEDYDEKGNGFVSHSSLILKTSNFS